MADSIGDQGVVENRLSEDFRLGIRFDFHETGPHIQPGSHNTFPEKVGCFLEFGGDKEPIDVMVIGTFVVDWKLDLICAVSQDFLPRFALRG